MRIRTTGEHEDADGMAIEPFALHDNLMLAGGIIASGGCVIVAAAPAFERTVLSVILKTRDFYLPAMVKVFAFNTFRMMGR